jgi:hypothetical protein
MAARLLDVADQAAIIYGEREKYLEGFDPAG